MTYVEFWKILFSPIRASWWLLDSFWHPEPKNKWFLLCRHDVRRVHEKFSSGELMADSSELMSSWKIFFSPTSGVLAVIFGILSPKTSDSNFVDMMYVEFMKNFLLADSSELMANSFWHPEPKNKWFLLCRHDVSSSWKIFFSPIRASWWLLESFWQKNKWF